MAGPFDGVLAALQQKVQQGAAKAGNALMGGAPNKAGSILDASQELARLQKEGPPDAMHYGAWQDRIATLQKQLASKK